MDKNFTPQAILTELENLINDSESKKSKALKETLQYSPSQLKQDIEKSFNQLIDGKGLSQSKAEEIVTDKFERFTTQLENIANKDTPYAGETLESLTAKVGNKDNISALHNTLEAAAKLAVEKHEALKLSNKDKTIDAETYDAKYNKIGYEYLAAKRDAVAQNVKATIGDSAIFAFTNRRFEQALDAEYSKTYTKDNLAETIAQDAIEHTTDRIEKSGQTIDGIKNIIERIKGNLSETGVGHDNDEARIILDAVARRFKRVKDISIDAQQLDGISGKLTVKLITSDGLESPLSISSIIDDISQEIHDNANFEKTPKIQAEFKNRQGNISPTVDFSLNDLGVDGKVALTGLAVSTAASWVARVAQADATESQQAKSEEEVQKRHRKRNSKLAFATVASVAGSAILFDGLITKGKYTKMIIEGAKNALTPSSASR